MKIAAVFSAIITASLYWGTSSQAFTNPILGPLPAPPHSSLSTFSVVNSASYSSSVAPGAFASIFGSGFLALTQVLFGGVPATVIYSSATQINIVVPKTLSPGTTPVQLRFQNGSSFTGTADVELVSPGIFTVNGSGTGLANAEAWDNGKNDLIYDPKTLLPIPVNEGDVDKPNYLILYGTGFDSAQLSQLTVSVGGIPTTANYIGPVSGTPGLDQINVLIPPPASSAAVNSVQVSVTTAGVSANLVSATLAAIPQGNVITTKAVYYRPAKASLFADLADDCGFNSSIGACSSPTPREAALLTLDQNFGLISLVAKANAVILNVGDDDSWQSQFGGGFPYDPVNRGKPQFGVAQELLVSVAQKHGLKVIFEVLFSTFHMSNVAANPGSDTFGSTSNPPGAYDFIHSMMAPASYYGNIPTTKLSLVGLKDHNISDFIGDPRIASWYYGGEWALQYDTPATQGTFAEQTFFAKYWPFFYGLVHYGGASNQLAGVYPGFGPDGAPDDPNCGAARLGTNPYGPYKGIEALKNFFIKNPTMPRPDIYSVEWYGTSTGGSGTGYLLSCIAPDLQNIIRHMRDFGYSVPVKNIGVQEGGTDYAVVPLPGQPQNALANQFYINAVNAAANVDGVPVAQMAVWDSDGDLNNGACATGDDGAAGFPSGDGSFHTFSGLFQNAPIVPPTSKFCPLYSTPSVGWHGGGIGGPFQLYNSSFPTQYGSINYTFPAAKGTAMGEAYGAH